MKKFNTKEIESFNLWYLAKKDSIEKIYQIKETPTSLQYYKEVGKGSYIVFNDLKESSGKLITKNIDLAYMHAITPLKEALESSEVLVKEFKETIKKVQNFYEKEKRK